jgi:uncharacterized membrane protein
MSFESLPSAQRLAARVATAAWVALLVLAVSWESVLAPLRPGGSWLALKALPLLLPLRGIVRGDVKAMQWALLLVLLYVGEGSLRLADPAPIDMLATVELAFGALFFVAAIVYLRPFKLAARGRSR